MWVPVAVWQLCELLYTCYLLTYLRYDTRCYFNVRSKADISQLNLPHGKVSSVNPNFSCINNAPLNKHTANGVSCLRMSVISYVLNADWSMHSLAAKLLNSNALIDNGPAATMTSKFTIYSAFVQTTQPIRQLYAYCLHAPSEHNVYFRHITKRHICIVKWGKTSRKAM